MSDASVGLVLKDPSCDLVARAAPLAERRGFSHLLFTELSIPDLEPITGRDPFVLSAVALAATERLKAGSGVAGTIFHTARHLAMRAATLQEQSDGRFVLGVGVSHRGFADVVGVAYPASPLAHTRAYCDELRDLRSRLAFGDGFPVWLAALGQRMAAVAAGHADGLLLNWVSPEWTARTITEATAVAGTRPTTGVLLRVDHPDALRHAADRYLTLFTSYARHFAGQGLADADAVAAATCGPADDPVALSRRIAAYHEAGADIVCVYPADMDEASILDVVTTTPTI
jgi:alkanesulfonate monooxygenase SsuD/methylene tetrahydromethanopterin reductase-like flavin-dependent oxidoreductase (luciferase family)